MEYRTNREWLSAVVHVVVAIGAIWPSYGLSLVYAAYQFQHLLILQDTKEVLGKYGAEKVWEGLEDLINGLDGCVEVGFGLTLLVCVSPLAWLGVMVKFGILGVCYLLSRKY